MSTLSILSKILAPIATIVLIALSSGYYISFISLHFMNLGHSEWLVGMMHSIYYAGLFLGAWKADHTILRVGHVRAYAAFCGINTACLLIEATTGNIWIWAITRFIMGFSIAVFYVVIESWFLGYATDKTRGTILSLYMMALYLAQGSSQYILHYIDISSLQPFLVAGFLGSLSQVPLTLTLSPPPHMHTASRHTLRSLLRRSPFGFSGCFISGIILSCIYSFLPLFATSTGFSVSGIVSISIFGGVLLQWPMGKISDVIDRRTVLIAISLATILSGIGLIVFTYPAWFVYLQVFLLGGLCFTLYPLSITQVCDRLHPDDITKASGALLLAYGLGSVVGPLIAPYFITQAPATGLPILISMSAALLSVIGIVSIIRRSAVPLEEQEEFVALPVATTPVGYDLDPRAPDFE